MGGMAIDPRRIEVIDDATAAMLRRLSPVERWEMANRMVVQAREMIRSLVRSQHPAWTADGVEAEVRTRMSHGAA